MQGFGREITAAGGFIKSSVHTDARTGGSDGQADMGRRAVVSKNRNIEV